MLKLTRRSTAAACFATFAFSLLVPLAAFAQDPDPVCLDLFERVKEPPADQPNSEASKQLEGCDSEQLYYGERTPETLKQARLCAYVEREGYDLPTVSGPAILMMLYANGFGVERNFELAQRFACEVGGSPEELAARRQLLEAYAKSDHRHDFDICDRVTSGFMKEICDGKAARLAKRTQ